MVQEKKSERLEIRLGYTEKQDFAEACDSQGDTPSGALRRFIRGYVRRADADNFSSAWRARTRKRFWLVALGSVSAALLMATGGVWALGHLLSDPTDDDIFTARDIDGDGTLSTIEHGLRPSPDDVPHSVMRVLDLDASGTISRDEFVSKGRMIYTDDGSILTDSTESMPELTLVEFEFDLEQTTSGIFEDAIVNSGDLDRLVIWFPDGTNAKFETNVEIRSGSNMTILSNTATFPSSVSVKPDEDGK